MRTNFLKVSVFTLSLLVVAPLTGAYASNEEELLQLQSTLQAPIIFDLTVRNHKDSVPSGMQEEILEV